MRLNKFLSQNTGLSRRKADEAIAHGRVSVGGTVATLGMEATPKDTVTLDGKEVQTKHTQPITILLNKPIGYVCSKNGQGNPTVYDLLPAKYAELNIAGRLDKDSSGLVILTNDGTLLNTLTHPSNNKTKIYEIELHHELSREDIEALKTGLDIGEKLPSRFFDITMLSPRKYEVTLQEGRNRQIRKMIDMLDNEVLALHRKKIGQYICYGLGSGKYQIAKL